MLKFNWEGLKSKKGNSKKKRQGHQETSTGSPQQDKFPDASPKLGPTYVLGSDAQSSLTVLATGGDLGYTSWQVSRGVA